MKKTISLPIAITIIVACAILTGLLTWQYGLISWIGPSGPSPTSLSSANYSECSNHYTVPCYDEDYSEIIKENIPCSGDNDCSLENMNLYCSPGRPNILKCIGAKYYCGKDGFCKGYDCPLRGEEAVLKLWMPGAEPDGIPPNTSTEVTFTVMATGAFPESLQLEQIDKEGNLIIAIGDLKDDGENDDLSANDGIYSGIFKITSEKEGKLYYRTTVEYGDWPYESEIYELAVTSFPVDPGSSDPDFLVVDPETEEKLYSNELLVSFKDEVSDERIRQIVSAEGASVIGTIPSIGVFQLQIVGDGTSEGVYTAVKAFQDYEEVEYAEPNYVAELD